MPRRKAPSMPSKRRRPVPEKTKKYVKRVINKRLAHDTDVYYLDNQTLSPTTTQQYIDLSAALHTSASFKSISVVNKHLLIKGWVQASDAYNFVRLVIFKWRTDTANATPGSNDVLRNDASASVAFGLPYYERRGDYKILYDRTFHTQAQTTGSVTPAQVPFTVKLSGKKLGSSRYNTSTSSGRDHIYMMYFSDSSAVAHPTIDYNLRMLYQADE